MVGFIRLFKNFYYRMKNSLFLFFFFGLSFSAYSQIDTEFWFAPPQLITVRAPDRNYVRVLCISAYSRGATVTISMPANSSFKPVVFTVPANGIDTLHLEKYSSLMQTATNNAATTADLILNSGVKITSDFPVSAYYAITGYDSEIYTLKGTNGLGTFFLIPMQYAKQETSGAAPSVEIVATSDNTIISITPSQACVGHSKGITFTKILNKGQTYTLKGSSNSAGSQLRNTIISSDKPIAVNTTDDMMNGGGTDLDLIGDQLVPTSLAGNRYIAISNAANVEQINIFPIQDNTVIRINGTIVATLNKGQEYSVTLSPSTATLITSDNNAQGYSMPFVAFQVTGIGNELGGTMLPSITCTGSKEVYYSPIFSQSPTVTILTKTKDIGSFSVNGSTFVLGEALFTPVSGDPNWSYCIRSLTTSSDKILRITNSTGYFHLGILESGSGTCSYGYFSNFNTIPLSSTTNKGYYMEGENIQLKIDTTEFIKTSIRWEGPNGFISNEAFPTIDNVTLANAGKYIVTASHVDGCVVLPDTFVVNIFKKSNAVESTWCQTGSYTLTAEGYGPYKWQGANNLPTTQSITINTPSTDTEFTVDNYKPGYNLILNNDFQLINNNFNSDYTYNAADITNPGNYVVGSTPNIFNSSFSNTTDHTYGNASGKQLIANCKAGQSTIWTQTIHNTVPGNRYVFSGWVTGAKAGDSPAKLHFSANDSLGALINPTTDGKWTKNDYIWVCKSRTTTLKIVTDASTTAGSSVCLDDLDFAPVFAVTDTFKVSVIDSLKPQIKGDLYVCNGSATIGVDLSTQSYNSYKWNTGEITQSINVTSPGTYWVEVTDGNCKGSNSFTVTTSPRIEVIIDTLFSVCPDQQILNIPYTTVSGDLSSYKIIYDSNSKSVGFVDKFINVTPTQSDFLLDIPMNVAAGKYIATIKTFTKFNCDSQSISISLTVKINPKLIMVQKWNDVIALLNKDYNTLGINFISFQWFINGQPAGNLPYLYIKEGLKSTDIYSVELTDEYGQKYITCGFTPNISADFVPTLVRPSQQITLRNISTTGHVTFSETNGLLYSKQSINKDNSQITAPERTGIYILNINIDNKLLKYKIIVQ